MSGSITSLRGPLREGRLNGVRPRVPELIIVGLAAVLVALVPGSLPLLAAAGIGLGVLALASTYPYHALVGLLVLVPLQVPVLALLYDLGLPGPVVRQAGFAKEALLAGILLAAARHAHRRRHHLDRTDRAIGLFVGLVAAYLIVPVLLDPVVTIFPSAPRDWYSKALALRSDLGFVVLLLAVRSLPGLTATRRRRAMTVLLLVASVIALGAIVEFVNSSWWENFEATVLHMPEYRADILDVDPRPATLKSRILGREFTRAGSVHGPLTLGFYLTSALAIALVRATRRPAPWPVLAAGLTGAGIIVTLTRSAVLGAAVLVAVFAWRYPGDRSGGKIRAAAAGVLCLIAVAILAEPTGLGDRTLAALRGEDPSAAGHEAASSQALELAIDRPLGLGLGYQPSVSQRTEGDGMVSENAYLQIANELGIIAMVLFIAVIWRTYRALAARSDTLAAAAAAALAGVAVGGLLLHVWVSIPTTWSLAVLIGLALPREGVDPPRLGTP